MPTFSYQLRPGVELVVDADVRLRLDLGNPTHPPEDVHSDGLAAQYTMEYLQAHIQHAFQSFDPISDEVVEQFYKKAG